MRREEGKLGSPPKDPVSKQLLSILKLGDKGPADSKGKLHQPQDSASSETIIQPWIDIR